MWPFSGLFSGLYGPPDPASVTIYKAYISSTGTLFGPTGWSCSRQSTGAYTVDTNGLDLTVGGVAAWAIGHYVGEDSFATPNCNIKFSSVNRDTCQVWTPRSRDGGERDQAFYFYVAVGTADTVKKAILTTAGTFWTSPFAPPTGWTSSRLSTGQFRITPNGGNDLTPGSSEAAVHVQPYGDSPTFKYGSAWEPEVGLETQARITTRRLLDGALEDHQSYMVWIDGLAVTNLVEGVAVSNGSFTGTIPNGWGASNPAPGRTDINPDKGNQPVQPVQDGLGWMVSSRRGQDVNGTGVTMAFDGTATIGNQTMRLLDGAATINWDFYFYALNGAAPE